MSVCIDENPFGQPPAWRDLADAGDADVAETIRLASFGSLVSTTAPRKLPSGTAKHLVEMWGEVHPVVLRHVAETAQLDADLINFLLAGPHVDALGEMARRSDVSGDLLHRIACCLLQSPSWHAASAIAKVASNPNCQARTLAAIRTSRAIAVRGEVLRAATLPTEIQSDIIENGSITEKLELLRHAGFDRALTVSMVKALLASDHEEGIAAAIYHPDLSLASLSQALTSVDVRVSACASDRICEVASRFNLKDYARFHGGFAGSTFTKFLDEHVRRRLPLGYAVYALFLLKGPFATKPETIMATLRWIRQQPRAANVRIIGKCQSVELAAISRLGQTISQDVYGRLLLRTIRSQGLTLDLLRDLAELEGSEAARSVWQTDLVRRVRDLPELVRETRLRLELSSAPDFRLFPFRVAPWLASIEGLTVGDGLRIRVARRYRTVVAWSVAMRNCLRSKIYEMSLRERRRLLIGVVRGRANVQYVFDVTSDGREIVEAKGHRNGEVPQAVRRAVALAIQKAIDHSESRPSQAPS